MSKKKIAVFAVVLGIVVAAGALVTVGGWHTNDGNHSEQEENEPTNKPQEDSPNPDSSNQDSSNPDSEKEENPEKGIAIEVLSEFNTDVPLENVYVEIDSHIGNQFIFKVTNDSNNCYRVLNTDIYFSSDPLPNRKPIDGEYRNHYMFYDIPAYSVTYHVRHAFCEYMGKEGEDEFDGYLYYPFDRSRDGYRVVFPETTPISSAYILSDKLLQNAMDYVKVDQGSADLSMDKLASLTNLADKQLRYTGFVIYDNKIIGEIRNGNTSSSCYDDVIPPYNEPYILYKHEIDTNSIYSDGDYNPSAYSKYHVVIGNAYFVDDIED